ncbi:MAG: response regulator, partial [Burkholderiaceae bacterium]|nr:response regulator [Burkholderiaceae bacterium]
SKNNYEVICALSAAEALERMKTESFDLMISDIVMPGMHGLELLKQVKTEWPKTHALMMTAYASTDTALKAIRLGALDYVSKPFTPDELRTIVQRQTRACPFLGVVRDTDSQSARAGDRHRA